jgi:hypothetical protein
MPLPSVESRGYKENISAGDGKMLTGILKCLSRWRAWNPGRVAVVRVVERRWSRLSLELNICVGAGLAARLSFNHVIRYR